MKEIKIGEKWRGSEIIDFVKLSNGWYIIKAPGTLSEKDFKVKAIFSIKPQSSLQPKHAHFAIDFYGKICNDKEKAMNVFKAIIDIWHRNSIENTLNNYKKLVENLPGYNLEYILYAMRWVLDQEDINFKGREEKKQRELDEICGKQNVIVPVGRKGSQLAMSLLCAIANGMHPVEAFRIGGLDVIPIRKRA